jgi:tetratricopeptide (TPR) repeat protein
MATTALDFTSRKELNSILIDALRQEERGQLEKSAELYSKAGDQAITVNKQEDAIRYFIKSMTVGCDYDGEIPLDHLVDQNFSVIEWLVSGNQRLVNLAFKELDEAKLYRFALMLAECNGIEVDLENFFDSKQDFYSIASNFDRAGYSRLAAVFYEKTADKLSELIDKGKTTDQFDLSWSNKSISTDDRFSVVEVGCSEDDYRVLPPERDYPAERYLSAEHFVRSIYLVAGFCYDEVIDVERAAECFGKADKMVEALYLNENEKTFQARRVAIECLQEGSADYDEAIVLCNRVGLTDLAGVYSGIIDTDSDVEYDRLERKLDKILTSIS